MVLLTNNKIIQNTRETPAQIHQTSFIVVVTLLFGFKFVPLFPLEAKGIGDDGDDDNGDYTGSVDRRGMYDFGSSCQHFSLLLLHTMQLSKFTGLDLPGVCYAVKHGNLDTIYHSMFMLLEDPRAYPT